MIQYIVIFGALAQLFGTYFYAKETIRGNIKPNRVTWLMWSIAPIIAAAAAFSDGVRWAVLPVFVSGFCPLLIFFASFVNSSSHWKLERVDYLCGLCSILALITWVVTKDPIVAIFFAVASDAFAAIPTLIKSWKYPETENMDTYTGGLLNAMTSFFAMKTWWLVELFFPIYLIVMNLFFIVLIKWRRVRK